MGRRLGEMGETDGKPELIGMGLDLRLSVLQMKWIRWGNSIGFGFLNSDDFDQYSNLSLAKKALRFEAKGLKVFGLIFAAY